MSMTVTETMPSYVVNLVASPIKFLQGLQALMVSIKVSGLPLNYQESLEQWKAHFDRHYAPLLKDEKNNERVAYALCYLLRNQIRPILLDDSLSLQIQEYLISFEERMKDILSLILSPQQNVEVFIQQYEQSANKKESLQNKLNRLQIHYQTKETVISQFNKQKTHELCAQFEATKQRILAMAKEKALAEEKLHVNVQFFTEQEQILHQKNLEQAQTFNSLSQHIQQEEERFRQTTSEFQT